MGLQELHDNEVIHVYKMKYKTFKEDKKMKFFVDTGKIEDIKKANDMGVICGVTTNPSLIAKEGGKSQEEMVKETTSIVDGPISGQVNATTVDAEVKIAE